ncbi:head-tail adaptor protein [Antarcticimicrobium luteum]|uniref:Head-tail adaptor protein n=1 Tax=Antarcticimicrobium luteum TaxID=2547397 RepID=A0A4R5VF64_9RHOB|nr:head-tail adaptor protein [Antarcticimicrobium luteum]TDK51141.1 head-tail adaptor protein [Antarcticimicrobium luteum]
MSAGGIPRRDRLVVLLRASVVENELGEALPSGWVEHARARASFAPVSDGERLRAAAVEQKSDARFVLRWSPRLAQVTGAFRLRFEGRDWQITGVKAIGRRRWIELTAWRLTTSEGV